MASAQSTKSGIPQALLDAKKMELSAVASSSGQMPSASDSASQHAAAAAAAAQAQVIAATLAPGGIGLVADPCRLKAAAFPTACRSVGLAVTKTRARRPRGATSGPSVEIHRVTWPG
jgi:hypothetical protein